MMTSQGTRVPRRAFYRVLRRPQEETDILFDVARGHYVALTHDLAREFLTPPSVLSHELYPQLDVRLVLRAFLQNLKARVRIKTLGWRVVRDRYVSHACSVASASDCDSSLCHDQLNRVISAVRAATLLPFASANCLQVATTISKLCDDANIAHEITIGTLNEPFQPHIWVESHGRVVDIIDSSAEREVFK